MEPRLEPFWMALVLEKETEILTVAAFDLCKEKAESSARERVARDAAVLYINVLGGAEQFAGKISLWLAENDIVGADNTKLVREIASGLKKMIDKMTKPKKRLGRGF